jgi:hypothetical protein
VCAEAWPNKQLDLLDLATPGAAQFGTSTAEIVWRDTWNAGRVSIRLDELPHDLFA